MGKAEKQTSSVLQDQDPFHWKRFTALVKAGLIGSGLIKVDTPEMVSRYNACLVDMDIEPTELTTFRIDGMGWSPEVAAEKKKYHYLFHGDANALGIVLTHDQYYAPIYVQTHSFDRHLMRQWFELNKLPIIELTKATGIWIDIDQDINTYHEREDLLLVDRVYVEAKTPDRLMAAADAQKSLIKEFMGSSDDLAENIRILTEIPQQLESSVQAMGNVSRKSMMIDKMAFSKVQSFYTSAFGGTFVFRSRDGNDEFVIEKNKMLQDPGVSSKREKDLLQRLNDFGLLSYDLEYWRKHLYRLEVKRDSFLMDTLSEVDPKIGYGLLSEIEKKKLLNRKDVKDALPEEFFLLNRLILKLEKGKKIKRVSEKVRPFLIHPHEDLDIVAREAVKYAIILICDMRSPVLLYTYDKEEFFAQYNTWEKCRCSWAISCIETYYQSSTPSKPD